jgi:hypothetical protein
VQELVEACKELVRACTEKVQIEAIPFDPPSKTYEPSFGGGECSKHGRYYGICHSCRADQAKHYRANEEKKVKERDKLIRMASIKVKAAIAAAERKE